MKFLGPPSSLLVVVAGLWTGCASAPPALPGDYENTGGTGAGGSGGASAGTTSGASGTTGGSATGATGGTTTGGASGASGTGTGGAGGTTTGSGGTMAATLCGQAVGMAADTNIDDIEDGDNTIGNGMGQPMPPTRVGYWFTYNETTDGSTTCKQTPPPDPSGLLPFPPEATPGNGSLFGAHTHGTGCTSKWGAGLGVDFNNCNMKSNPYDGSAYKGISFWYKSTTPIRVLVGTLPNLPTASGGTCASDCYNHHGKNFAASTGGTTATITWAELMGSQQIGSPPANPQTYGTMRTFDPKQLLNIEIQVDQASGSSFDFWVDTLLFL